MSWACWSRTLSLSLGIRNYKFIRNQIIPKQKKTENFKGLVFLINANYGLIGSRAAFSHIPALDSNWSSVRTFGDQKLENYAGGMLGWEGKDFQHPFSRHSYRFRPYLHILGISPRKWSNLSVLCIRYRYYLFFLEVRILLMYCYCIAQTQLKQ